MCNICKEKKRLKLFWYLKQLIPLTYRSKYRQKDKVYFVVWKMWLGRCFDRDEYQIVINIG